MTDIPSDENQLADLIGSIQDRMNDGQDVDLDVVKKEFPKFAHELETYFNCGSLFEQALDDKDRPRSLEDEDRRLDLKAFPIERRLPDIALGTVYRLSAGQAEKSRDLVVMKAWLTPQQRASIERSVRHAMSYQGPGLVPIVDMGRLNQVPFVLREFFGGRNLEQMFDEILLCGGALTMKEAVRGEVGEDVDNVDQESMARAFVANEAHMSTLLGAFRAWARCLDQAHEVGLVHREIEPRNLKIDSDGHCAIGGAGLSWQGTDIDPKRMRDWRPHWLAPEIVDTNWGHVTWLSDVYSLARGLAACLSLEMPSSLDDSEEVLMRIAVGDRTWLDTLPSNLDDELRDLIDRATFPDPSRRLKNLKLFAQKITALIPEDKGRDSIGWAARIFKRSHSS